MSLTNVHEQRVKGREKNPFGWAAFVEKYIDTNPLLVVCSDGRLSRNDKAKCGYYNVSNKDLDIDDLRLTVSFRSEYRDRIATNVMVMQEWDSDLKRYRRKVFSLKATIPFEKVHRIFLMPDRATKTVEDYRFIEQLRPNDRLIGLFYSEAERRLHVLFDSMEGIIYCTVIDKTRNECLENKYQLLVYCDKTLILTKSTLITVFLIVGLIFIIFFSVILCLVYFYMKRRNQRDENFEPKTTSVDSIDTVQTVNSITGLPISIANDSIESNDFLIGIWLQKNRR